MKAKKEALEEYKILRNLKPNYAKNLLKAINDSKP
jgi:hypothetical protein